MLFERSRNRIYRSILTHHNSDDKDSDPALTSDTGKLDRLLSPVLGKDTMDCLIGGTFSVPPPKEAKEAIQPFDPRICMKQSVFTSDDHITPIIQRKVCFNIPAG